MLWVRQSTPLRRAAPTSDAARWLREQVRRYAIPRHAGAEERATELDVGHQRRRLVLDERTQPHLLSIKVMSEALRVKETGQTVTWARRAVGVARR